MTNTKYKNIIRWAVAALSFIIVGLILWNTYDFFQKFKHEERQKMEVLSEAYKRFNSAGLKEDITLSSKIISSNNNIPMIVTDAQDSIILNQNLDSIRAKKAGYLKKQLAIMKAQNEPLEISYNRGNLNIKNFVYYRDSELLTKLKYYPLALIFILILFGIIIYLVFKSNKIAEQNKLWAGMAKETAHQIGTPLTSLLGWLELLKEQNADKKTVSEIEKDIERLTVIANRFSNIGSIPKMKKTNLISEIKTIESYFKSRISKGITLSSDFQIEKIYVNLNPQLFSWVIENLIKNAIDALKGEGAILLSVKEKQNSVLITVSDTGKGIPKKNFKAVFKPGYTTKKRGWGLGLSLAKRIIENYHEGKIYIHKSTVNKGTSIRLELPLVK
ncbi:MAG: HAMP domain-containing sensor histidine kinase [Flavobacteriaceae bacterium]